MMAPCKRLTSRGSVQTQVAPVAVILREVEAEGDLSGGEGLSGLVRAPAWKESLLRLALPSSLLPGDLVAQNIDVVLNRRNCMAATLRIIEENIPEVRPSSAFETGGSRVG